VKKRLGSISFFATVAVTLAMISFGGLLHAQTSPDAQQPTPQTQQPPDTQAPSPQTEQPSGAPSTQQPNQPSQTPNQAQPPQTPEQAQPSSTPEHAAQPDTSGSKEFVGTVVKQGDKYVFQDAATGTTYDIDHQDDVKKFDGKRVRVHGTLDADGKIIHVQ
jgi:uncharacterized protein YdeI (BOF family)